MARKNSRQVVIDGDVALIELTGGHWAKIDVSDLGAIARFSWHAIVSRKKDGSIRSVYASRNAVKSDGKGCPSRILMHRAIMGSAFEEEVDHVDGDGLNNRRTNLRRATHSQNMHNQRLSVANTSGQKGVTFNRASKKWQAQIKKSGKVIYLGVFPTIEMAAKAYADASVSLHGDFGRVA